MSTRPRVEPQRSLWRLLLDWFGRLRRPVRDLIGALWLCGFCSVFFLLGAWFFLANDQGLDFLRMLAESFRDRTGLSLRNAFFFLGVIAWSLSTWYCARLLLSRRFPAQPVDLDATKAKVSPDATARLRTVARSCPSSTGARPVASQPLV